MMWFASKEKVEKRLSELIERMERLSKRIAHYEEQERLSIRLGMPSNGEVAQTRDAHAHMFGTLNDARAGISAGSVNFREIHPQLPSVSKAIAHMEWILNEADKDVARAKQAFRDRFGGE